MDDEQALKVMDQLSKAEYLICIIDRIANGRNASVDYDMLRIAVLLDEYYGRND